MLVITAQIEGKNIPLTDCDWVLWGPCGCPFGVTLAATALGGVRAADEDAAFRCLYHTKRDADRARRRGCRVELMSHERYVREVCPRMSVRCEHANDVKAATHAARGD